MEIKYIYGENQELLYVEITADQWKSIENFIGKDVGQIRSSSMTTDAREESIKQIKPISLTIKQCKAGWIPMIFSSRTAWVMINVSDCFDPFQGVIDWLCKISDEVFPASLIIDEEGSEKVLFVDRVSEKYLKFTISDLNYEEGLAPDPEEDDLEYPRTYINTFIELVVLVNELYAPLKLYFSNKNNYSNWMPYGNKNYCLNFSQLEESILKRERLTSPVKH